jgi:diacylglycerol kinase family enzyme
MEPAKKHEAPPRPITGDRALILFNEAAGSVSAGDREKLVAAVTEAGINKYALVGPEKITKHLFDRAKNFDVIIVLGGDGTARSAAKMAPRNGPPLILLPGGTLNILPKVLYGNLAWPEALKAALERGVVKRLPVGRANGKHFFIAALFGAPTLLARAREAVREGKPVTALKRLQHFTKRSFARSLSAKPEGQRRRRAEGIGVLCPSFSGALEGPSFEWVRLDANNMLDLARVGVRTLGPGWRDDATVEISTCARGEINSAGVIPATLDGEPRTFLSHVRVSYDRNGPRVIALEAE